MEDSEDEELVVTSDPPSRRQEILSVPPWAQDKLNENIIRRKDLFKKRLDKENAIRVLSEHKAKGTAPKSLTPGIQLHVTDKHKADTAKFLDDLNEKYTVHIVNHLITVRTKEKNDINKEIEDIERQTKLEITTSIHDMIAHAVYDGDPSLAERDITGYMNVYRLESKRVLKEIRFEYYQKNKKKEESLKKKAIADAEKRANLEMTDPTQAHLKRLEAMIMELKKNAPENGTGRQPTRPMGPRPEQPPTNQGRTPQTNRGRGRGRGRGNGRQRRPRPSTATTNPSGSEPTTSAAKRN